MLIVLDVDDTLLHTSRVAFRKIVLTAERLGLAPPTHAEFTACYGRIPYAECVLAWHGDIDLDEHTRVYDSLLAEIAYEPIGAVSELLRRLISGGHRVAVLTNGPGAKTTLKLAAAGVDPAALQFIRHADNARFVKPDVRAFLDLVADHGMVAADSVYVSDHPEDGVAARAAGLDFYGVCSGLWAAADFLATGTPADRILADVWSLPLAQPSNPSQRSAVPA